MILFFFFNDTATTEIYTLSLHDALPISLHGQRRSAPGATHHSSGVRCGHGHAGGLPHGGARRPCARGGGRYPRPPPPPDRKSTRPDSPPRPTSECRFCLQKKNQTCRAPI